MRNDGRFVGPANRGTSFFFDAGGTPTSSSSSSDFDCKEGSCWRRGGARKTLDGIEGSSAGIEKFGQCESMTP